MVGHSNTVPDIVAAIGGQSVADMPETEYDRFTVLVLRDDGGSELIQSRY